MTASTNAPLAHSKGRRVVFVLAGLLSSAAFMLLAVRRLAFDDVTRALTHAELWPWLPLGVLSYLAGHAVRGIRCRRLASGEARLTRTTATNVVVLGYAVNNILPARLGEFARAAMLAERSGLPFAQGLSITFLERILDGLIMLGLLAVAFFSLPQSTHQGWLGATLQIAALVFSVALVGVLAAVLAPSLILRWTSRVAHRVAPRMHDRFVRVIDQAVRGVAYLREPRAALGIAALSLLVWLCEAGLFLCLLPAFGLAFDPRLALLAMTVTNLGILVPSSPGFIGPFHFFCMRALTAVGIAEATGFGYAALVHLAFYVPITLWGVGIIVAYGFRLGANLDAQKSASPLGLLDPGQRFLTPGERSDPAPSAITIALCEALIPEESADVPAHAEVVKSCASFTAGQLAALPFRLRVYYGVGMLALRTATLLRFARPFCKLDQRRRRRWVEAWAYGRLSLGRALLRAPRSTTLLAYYEHPAVQGALGVEPSSRSAASDAVILQLKPGRRANG
ncbi:MAG: flippase-like domain-containing protein [Polyangiaceae bacterium]|nr:flippase-like domain-containing protein [Polyangiaceae bacterium]